MAITQKISPCLWFDTQGEDAAKFYTSVFPNSRIVETSRYSEAGQDAHHQKAGTVMMVVFELDGQKFMALNGGPAFKFTEAISLQIFCDTQEEVDRYWEKLTAGGDPKAQQCGWLKDKFGLSWQVVASPIISMIKEQGTAAGKRAMEAMMQQKKPNISEVQRAYDGAKG